MPSCSVTGCRSKTGYRRYDTIGRRISIHRFPTNPVIRELWVRRLNKKNWVCTENSGVCSLHFKETDFDDDYRASCQDIVRKLRKTAVPSIGLLGLDPILGIGIKPRNRSKPKSVNNGQSLDLSMGQGQVTDLFQGQGQPMDLSGGQGHTASPAQSHVTEESMEEDSQPPESVNGHRTLHIEEAGIEESNGGAINLTCSRNTTETLPAVPNTTVITVSAAKTPPVKATLEVKAALEVKATPPNRVVEKAVEPRQRVIGLVAPPMTTQMNKYSQLLVVLEEVSKDIRPTYANSRSSAERLKRGIMHARMLVRDSILELDKASKQ